MASDCSSIVASDCGSIMASGRNWAESSDHDSGAKFSPNGDKRVEKAGSPLTKTDQGPRTRDQGQIVAKAPTGRDQEAGQSSLAARQVGKAWQETDFLGGGRRRANCAGNPGNAEEERRENEKEILKSL